MYDLANPFSLKSTPIVTVRHQQNAQSEISQILNGEANAMGARDLSQGWAKADD